MNGRMLCAGIAIIIFALLLLLPGLILSLAGSPVSGETDIGRIVGNLFLERSDSPTLRNIVNEANKGYAILDFIPYLILLTGIVIIILGLIL